MKLSAAGALLWVVGLGCSTDSSICSVCMREKCEDLITICEADADCACMVTCTGDNGIPGVEACLGTCGLELRPSNFAQVEECTAVACPDSEDECATPSDWTRPGDVVSCDHAGSGTIGGGTLADCGFDRQMAFDPDGAVLQLESADMSVCARIERTDLGAGKLANTEWELHEIRVGMVGEVWRVGDSDVCWYSSHHNFRDWVHVWTGGRHFDLALKADINGGPTVYELFAYEQGPVEAGGCAPDADGAMCIEGPIELFAVRP